MKTQPEVETQLNYFLTVGLSGVELKLQFSLYPLKMGTIMLLSSGGSGRQGDVYKH